MPTLNLLLLLDLVKTRKRKQRNGQEADRQSKRKVKLLSWNLWLAFSAKCLTFSSPVHTAREQTNLTSPHYSFPAENDSSHSQQQKSPHGNFCVSLKEVVDILNAKYQNRRCFFTAETYCLKWLCKLLRHSSYYTLIIGYTPGQLSRQSESFLWYMDDSHSNCYQNRTSVSVQLNVEFPRCMEGNLMDFWKQILSENLGKLLIRSATLIPKVFKTG